VAAARRLRRWRQRDSATSAAAWRGRGGGAQRGDSSAESAAVAEARQRDVGGSLAAVRWQGQRQRWGRQGDSATSAARWQQRGGCGGGGSATARRRWQPGGGAVAVAASAVGAARRQRDVGGSRRQRKLGGGTAAAAAAAAASEKWVWGLCVYGGWKVMQGG
jgi:hypothetical protein